jgi:2-keto-4-pentenoate hydratase
MLFERAPQSTAAASTMHHDAISAAADLLWRHWTASTRIPELPEACRPSDRRDGYAIQRALTALSAQPVVGWKIAATSLAGQRHIGVDGPLGGSLLADRILTSGASGGSISLDGNHMRVAEAEFAFRFGRPLPPREEPYGRDEVLEAVKGLHPTIEIPDSRYDDFARVGAPQLIADNACASWLLVGAVVAADWRRHDLASHTVETFINGRPAATGSGSNVLGDPRAALTWMANELRVYGGGVRVGDLVTTGTCIAPVAIAPGDSFRADFGEFGALEVQLR